MRDTTSTASRFPVSTESVRREARLEVDPVGVEVPVFGEDAEGGNEGEVEWGFGKVEVR
jgi:hypothetical protein